MKVRIKHSKQMLRENTGGLFDPGAIEVNTAVARQELAGLDASWIIELLPDPMIIQLYLQHKANKGNS